MMSLEQYRSAIDSFACVIFKLKEQINSIQDVDLEELYEQFEHMPHVLLHFWKHYLLHYLGIYKTINEAILKWKLLQLLNDIHENPGPEFSKSVFGSFHQSSKKFGSAAGRQCCAISLYSLAFSVVKDVNYWTSNTVDGVVEHGTSLYHRIGKYEFLGVEDLPSIVEMFDESINIEFKFNSHGILSRDNDYVNTLKDMICGNMNLDDNSCSTGFLLLLFTFTFTFYLAF